MQALKGRVENGRIKLDAPTDLPEGKEVHLAIVDDDVETADESLSDADRADLQAQLTKAREDLAAGRTVDAREFMRKLAERHP